MSTSQIKDNTINIERVFNAPIKLVWRAWTEPNYIKQWWGPDGFTTTIHKMEIKTGGEWLLTMHGPDGTDYENVSVFDEIITEQKIVYTHESEPKFTTTVLFYAEGDKTRINWTMVFDSAESLRNVVENYGADKGLDQNMNKLEVFIANMDNSTLEKTKYTAHTDKKQLEIERVFNAGIDMVWRAWTEPEILDQWWAPKPWKTVTHSMDFKAGGRWLYSMNGPEGEQHKCSADYKTVTPKQNYTAADAFCDENWNPTPDMPNTNWDVSFKDNGNTTIVNIIATYPTKEAMETIIKMGFKEGFAMAHNNLDELLDELKK